MSALINIAVHASQFPAQVQADLRESLRTRQINHKFLYDSYKQTQKWLELHHACAPSRTDADCAACYDSAFAAAATKIKPGSIHLIGLGCGGGQKDARLLNMLKENSNRLFYTPVDVSMAMVLVAHQTTAPIADEARPLVCDLAAVEDIASVLGHVSPKKSARVLTFFGMMPNFEPQAVLPKLPGVLCSDDLLLLSANLAPGEDYAAGLRQVLRLYDNALTRDWLLMFLLDLGVEKNDGALEWAIESCPGDLMRLTAWFRFEHSRSLRVAGEEFQFRPGEKIRLFFSYRYTVDRLHHHLDRYGLRVQDEWITKSGEEGVFLCRCA